MDGSFTTNKGLALISKLMAQKGALKITRVSVGDGTPPGNPATLTNLVHKVQDATLEGVTNPQNGEAKIQITVSSIGVHQGYFIREIGVFAQDPEDGEVLYAYAGFADNPQWIRPEGEAITNVVTYDINTIIDRVQSVQVVVDPSSFATKQQLNALDSRVAELERQNHPAIYGVRWPKGASASKGERIYDAVGMTAAVGVGAEPVVNDFDKVYPFAGRRRCNGYRDTDRTFHVTAYEGEPGFSKNDPAKLVYVETPLFWYYDGELDGYEVKAVSPYPIPGFLPAPECVDPLHPDAAPAQYGYSAAYRVAMEGDAESKKPSSRSGVYSDYNSLNNWATDIQKLGKQYTGMLFADFYTDMLLMMVEFATKDLQTVMMGASSMPYSDQHKALMAEESVNRIVIAKAQADLYVVGQAISISASVAGDEIAKNRTVERIEAKSTDDSYIYFDGAAVDIAVGNIVSSRPWVNGATDVVVASSGSPVSNTDGKHPCVYRGKEDPYGDAWIYVADVLADRTVASEPEYKYHMNFLPDPTKYAAGAISGDYVKLNYEIPSTDGYVKEFSADQRFPWVQAPKSVGGSSTTYYACYYWFPRSATTPVIAGGCLDNGRSCGFSLDCRGAPSNSDWTRRARLS